MTPDRFVNYTLGISGLDEKHWGIFGTIGTIVKILKTDPTSNVSQYLDELVIKFVEHAEYEAQMMNDCNYPYAKWHLIEHQTMLDSIARIRIQLEASKVDGWVLGQFENMFINHLDHSDRQLTDWYIKVSPRPSLSV